MENNAKNGLLSLLLSNSPDDRERKALEGIDSNLSELDIKNLILSDKTLYPKSYKAVISGLKPSTSESWYQLIGKSVQISSISLKKIKENELIIADINGKNYSLNKSVLAHFMNSNGDFVKLFLGISSLRSFDSKSNGYYIAFELTEDTVKHLKRRKALKMFNTVDKSTPIEIEHSKKVLNMLNNLETETDAEMQNLLKSKGIAYTAKDLAKLFEEHC